MRTKCFENLAKIDNQTELKEKSVLMIDKVLSNKDETRDQAQSHAIIARESVQLKIRDGLQCF